jgi:hypothetical protein
MLAEFLGILLELDLSCDELLVLRGPVDLACFLVFELYEIILSCHSYEIVPYFMENCKSGHAYQNLTVCKRSCRMQSGVVFQNNIDQPKQKREDTLAIDQDEDLSVAQAALQKFMPHSNAASAPPSSPSASGSSGSSGTGSGSSGANGSGGSPPSDPPGTSKNTPEPKGKGMWDNMGPRQWVLFIAMIVVAGCAVFLIMWRTSRDGLQQESEQKVLDSQGIALEMKKEESHQLRILERDRARAIAAGIAPPSIPAKSTPSPTSACIDARGKGGKRAEAIELSYGSCVSFSTTSNQSSFWVSFKGHPRGVIGDAVFGSFHDATDGDREERHARCMQKTNDREYCDGEKRKPLVIRDDRGCGSAQASDHCLAYLKSKAEQGTIPVWVQTYTSVQINM